MKTKNQQPNSRVAFLSIDDWQDDEPIKGSWLDNPFVGTLGVIGAITCLFFWPRDHAERFAQSPLEMESESVSGSLDEALAGLNTASTVEEWDFPYKSLRYLADSTNFDPSQKRVVQDAIMDMLATNPTRLEGVLEVFSIWFDTEDSRRISTLFKKFPDYPEALCLAGAMSKLPNPVPGLLSEMTEHTGDSVVHMALSTELSNHNVQPAEIARQLANMLRVAVNPQDFERIVLMLCNIPPAISDLPWETRDDPELKQLIASAMVSAGRNLTPGQLEKMNINVPDTILRFAQLPENSALLEKLAETSSGTARVMSFLGRNKQSKEAGDFAVKLARANKIKPQRLVAFENSELVQQFLWEGTLKGNEDFLNLKTPRMMPWMKSGDLNGFSKAGVSLIDSDPNSAIESLLTVVRTKTRSNAPITRQSVSNEFLRKLDALLADKLKDDLRLPANYSNTGKRQPGERSMPASMDLAERLGGKNSALAIAKAGKKKPEVLREFKGMLGALIALNEPETHGMIVNAWVIHGDVDGLENIGEVIEPRFIDRLQAKLKNLNAADKQQRRVIHFLTSALAKIGTSKSIPILESLTESKIVGFQKASAQAIETIRERSDRR